VFYVIDHLITTVSVSLGFASALGAGDNRWAAQSFCTRDFTLFVSYEIFIMCLQIIVSKTLVISVSMVAVAIAVSCEARI
jgi:hypothetical protein